MTDTDHTFTAEELARDDDDRIALLNAQNALAAIDRDGLTSIEQKYLRDAMDDLQVLEDILTTRLESMKRAELRVQRREREAGR